MTPSFSNPAAARVTKISEQVRLEANNQTLTYMHIEFMVGSHGPFYRDVLKSSFDPMQVKADLDTYARSLATLTS
jgi:hypothetical protein